MAPRPSIRYSFLVWICQLSHEKLPRKYSDFPFSPISVKHPSIHEFNVFVTCVSVSLSPCLCLPVSVCACPNLPVCVCLNLPLCLNLSAFLCLCLVVSLCVCITLTLLFISGSCSTCKPARAVYDAWVPVAKNVAPEQVFTTVCEATRRGNFLRKSAPDSVRSDDDPNTVQENVGFGLVLMRGCSVNECFGHLVQRRKLRQTNIFSHA